MIDQRSTKFPWVLLAALSATYLLSSLDRIVINLLVEPIKADFGLSDTEISLLQGPAFMAMFSLAIVPMGILVDRSNRTRLLAIGLGFWSVMTGLCGVASTYWALFAARAGVGLGEATLNPSGYSLISDAFKKERLGLALGLFIMGGAIGTGFAFLLGGAVIGELSRHGDLTLPLLGVLRPWQLTFVILAAPGLLLATVLLAMPNPARKMSGADVAAEGSTGMLKAFYLNNKALIVRHHIAMGATNMALLGMLGWIAPLLSRVHGWELSSIGIFTGLTLLVAHPIGTLLIGGVLGDYLIRYGAQMRLVVCAISLACAAVCAAFYPLIAETSLVVLLFGASNMFAAVTSGAGNAAFHHVVPGEIRGRVSAINYLIVLGFGMAGPVSVAVVSDTLFPFQEGIRYATVIVIPAVLIVASLLLLWAIAPYRRLLADEVDVIQPEQNLSPQAA